MKKYPLHSFLFSIYPALALFSVNFLQVSSTVFIRPVLISLGLCTAIFLAINLLVKNLEKTGLIVSLFLILFFSYGHLYQFLESSKNLGQLGHHRFLLIFYLVIFVLGIFGVILKLKGVVTITRILNWVSIILISISLVQIAFTQGKVFIANEKVKQASTNQTVLQPPQGKPLPDIYYIVLDMHTRSDVLNQDYGYDETAFVQALENLGFFVAKCSRSNYGETSESFTSTFNMDYLEKIATDFKLSSSDVQSSLLKQSFVRMNLKTLGYKTVAFETEYPWSDLEDADYFISPTKSNLALRSISPFESMLIDSTALLPYREYRNHAQIFEMSKLNHPWKEHIELVRFNLKNLSEVPKINEPLFVFSHILVPHIPFVFSGDGTLRTDPDFWEGKNAHPVDAIHEKEGYSGQVEFIDNQVLSIVQKIIANSTTQPIIVIMGDHGFKQNERNKILNAYYFPDGDYSNLTSTISPVNSFRVIFDQFFGTQFGKIQDRSFNLEKETFEDSPACKTP
jgi:hypothetical protein